MITSLAQLFFKAAQEGFYPASPRHNQGVDEYSAIFGTICGDAEQRDGYGSDLRFRREVIEVQDLSFTFTS